VPIEVGSEYDCGYEGGLNCQWSNTEYDGTDSDLEWSDSEIVWLNWREMNLRQICMSLRRKLKPSRHPSNMPKLQPQSQLSNGRRLNGTKHWGIWEIQNACNSVKPKKHENK
jgi:hypothetical protein